MRLFDTIHVFNQLSSFDKLWIDLFDWYECRDCECGDYVQETTLYSQLVAVDANRFTLFGYLPPVNMHHPVDRHLHLQNLNVHEPYCCPFQIKTGLYGMYRVDNRNARYGDSVEITRSNCKVLKCWVSEQVLKRFIY